MTGAQLDLIPQCRCAGPVFVHLRERATSKRNECGKRTRIDADKLLAAVERWGAFTLIHDHGFPQVYWSELFRDLQSLRNAGRVAVEGDVWRVVESQPA